MRMYSYFSTMAVFTLFLTAETFPSLVQIHRM